MIMIIRLNVNSNSPTRHPESKCDFADEYCAKVVEGLEWTIAQIDGNEGLIQKKSFGRSRNTAYRQLQITINHHVLFFDRLTEQKCEKSQIS